MRNLSIFLGLAIAVFVSAQMAKATQVINDTLQVSSLRVGLQGVGGVTFFNGTIVNETTTDGADNPVTFGDNVRIDGRLYSGATPGTTDTHTFKINDNVEIAGTLTVGGQRIATTDYSSQINSLSSDITDNSSQINSLSSDIADIASIDEMQTDILTALLDSVDDLQEVAMDNRDFIVQHNNFITCIGDWAELTTYLESSDFIYCWNTWIAGELIPTPLTLTTTGLDLHASDVPEIYPKLESKMSE